MSKKALRRTFVGLAACIGAACSSGAIPEEDAGVIRDTPVSARDVPPTPSGDVPRPSGEARPITWLTAGDTFRPMTNARILLRCAPMGTYGIVLGTGVYADHSSICTAAAHDRRITIRDGGDVELVVLPGRASYRGSTGGESIMSGDWKSAKGSYEFSFPPRIPEGEE